MGEDGNDDIFGMDDHDHLYGHDGNDYLRGDSGNDVLDGGRGSDDLSGGSGDDTFVFYNGNATFDGVKVTDWVHDFQKGADLIDLSDYWYDTGRPGSENLALVFAEQFTGKAGQFTLIDDPVPDSNVTYVEIDLDGDAKADEKIGVLFDGGKGFLSMFDFLI
jgi:Ca2+-binding RTX toxin-like protein